MTRLPSLDQCHALLVQTCEDTFKPSANPMPITVVSMSDSPQAQAVVVDATKFSPKEIAKRLRLAADTVERETNHPRRNHMAGAINIITAVCDKMNGNGYSHRPRIVQRSDFDLSKFEEQPSDYKGVKTEWVNQSGPGICGDDFTGILAVPIDAERLFVIEYAT